MAIRVMKATLSEIQNQCRGDFIPAAMGDNFGVSCDIFPDFPLCIQWNSTMQMDGPGRYILPTTVNLDFCGKLRAKLQEDVDLTNCTLLMRYGDLQSEKYEDQSILLMAPEADATHVLLTINWSINHPPFYDTALTGRFATKYGAVAYARHEPGQASALTPDNCGTDQWLLRMDALGEDFRQTAIEYAEVKEILVNLLWEDLDLKKAYYRQQFEQYEHRFMTPLRLGLVYHDDYIELQVSTEVKQYMELIGYNSVRMWYCESHLKALQEAVQALRITVGHSVSTGGFHGGSGFSGMFGGWDLF